MPAHPLQGMADGQRAGLEVQVRPGKPEDLPLAQSDTQGHEIERLKPVSADRPQEHLRLGRRVELAVLAGELVITHGGTEIARHRLVGPGEMSLEDAHYGRPPRTPVRAVRPRSEAEIAFCGLGPVAIAFLRAAAASGTSRLAHELDDIVALGRAYGRESLLGALERALAFHRYGAADVRAILAAGTGTPAVRPAGARLALDLPRVPVRPLAAYALELGR